MISIQPMQQQDVVGVFEVGKICLPQEAWSHESIFSELGNKNAVSLIAVEQERVVGFINAHVILDEANINMVAVLPQYQRKGIAKLLLEQLVSQIPLSIIMLEVRKSNQPAILFYRNNGFEQVGERKNFYHNPVENALLFNRVIKEGNGHNNENIGD